MAFTNKQIKFIDEYIVDMNATQAYLRAGYKCTEEAARRAASRLLTNVDISSEIAKRQKQLQEDTHMDQKWILEQYKYIYESNKDKDASVAKNTLDSVAKHLGMFTEKLDITISKKLEDLL